MLITSVSWTFWASPCKNLGPIKVLWRIFFSSSQPGCGREFPGHSSPHSLCHTAGGCPASVPAVGMGVGCWPVWQSGSQGPSALPGMSARGWPGVSARSRRFTHRARTPFSSPSGLRNGLPLGGDCAVHIQLCQISGWPRVGAGGRGQETCPGLAPPCLCPPGGLSGPGLLSESLGNCLSPDPSRAPSRGQWEGWTYRASTQVCAVSVWADVTVPAA